MNWNWTNTSTNRADAMSLRGGVCVPVSAAGSVQMLNKDFIAHEPGGSLR